MRYLKAKAWVPSTWSAWEKHTASPAADGAYFTLKSADCSLCAGISASALGAGCVRNGGLGRVGQ